MDGAITDYEILDLGVAPVGAFDAWGPGHNERHDAVMLGEGPTAMAAMECALNELALAGYDTRLLHEAGIEHGLHSPSARQQAAQIWRETCDDEDDPEAEVLYYVGIRYSDPLSDDSDDSDDNPIEV